MNKKIQILQKIEAFRGIAPSDLESILDFGKFVQFKNRAVVIKEDEPGHHIYFVVKGRAMVYKTSDDGKIKSLSIVNEGELFGEMAIITNLPRSASVKAIGPLTLLKLDAVNFKKLLKDNSSIAMSVLASLCQRLQDTNKHIEVLFYQSVPERTVKALVMLASSKGSVKTRRRRLVLTQQELAELVGSAREVVNRTLQILKRDGMLVLKKGAIEIPDLNKLKEYKIN
ncbi:MAG: Crp/Fnr family transcriptional regulator [Candidatus Omnitrophota bacterium]|nr:Crp/Fnr family transcriptional regulator [Candidatus Omnitrophota bacterium]MBU2528659.1 Crp/Fnr family transcriptional regulator [bacterium]MBU3929450.1 Crp/Fnr family transcriptional regulator [bacterium]MBU4122853.1 Crp/Fnr family transcriptional regulator [bacterium]